MLLQEKGACPQTAAIITNNTRGQTNKQIDKMINFLFVKSCDINHCHPELVLIL